MPISYRKILSKYHKGEANKKNQNEDDVRSIFFGSSVKEIQDNTKKTEDKFSESVVKNSKSFCSLSIYIINKLVKKVGTKSLKDCFIRDFEVAKYFLIIIILKRV